MPGRGYGKGGKKGRGGGKTSTSSSSSSSSDAPLDDAACRALGFDAYDPVSGQCINIAVA